MLIFIISHAAVSYGHIELIEFLLQNGANIHLRDVDGDTPLLYCEDPSTLQLLLRYGANINDSNSEGGRLINSLVDDYDDNEEMISYLVTNGFFTEEDVQSLIAKTQINIGDIRDHLEGIDEANEHDDGEDDAIDVDIES